MKIFEIVENAEEDRRRHAEISAYLVALGQHGGKLPSSIENAAIQIYMSNKNLETDQAVSIAKATQNKNKSKDKIKGLDQPDATKFKKSEPIDRDRTDTIGRSLQHDRYYKDDGTELFPGVSGFVKQTGDAIKGSLPGAKELSDYLKKATTGFKRGFNTKLPTNKK